MEIHHDRHHQAFVTNLNNFAAEHPQLAATPIPKILGNLDSVPEAIRNRRAQQSRRPRQSHHGSGKVMGPNGGKPQGEVLGRDRPATSGGME